MDVKGNILSEDYVDITNIEQLENGAPINTMVCNKPKKQYLGPGQIIKNWRKNIDLTEPIL